MDSKEFLQLAKKRYITIISIVMVFIIIALIGTLLQPLKYRSKSRLLITQPDTAADAYAVARSNQYIGGLISEVIYSGAFLETLNSSDAVFDRNYFSGTYKQNLKKWKQTVFARSGGDSGVIEIEIYHTSPSEARQISLAVNNIIVSGQGPYKFTSNQTKISTIDQPIISTFPVKPNIPLNLLAGLLFGILFGFSYVYMFPESQSERILKKAKTVNQGLNPNQTPVYQSPNPVYQTQIPTPNKEKVQERPLAPNNLPIYAYDEEADEIMQWPEEAPLSFQGNINNVLGE